MLHERHVAGLLAARGATAKKSETLQFMRFPSSASCKKIDTRNDCYRIGQAKPPDTKRIPPEERTSGLPAMSRSL
ncbi:hypothetical protein CERZMDRAFT_91974 [Cercospora zeae-maydis SCOH1-5]|uniref:Uncharacterized protein n=1 Tax=Cercospora zeae-maydis SCOH1-5 TaxID=717836 RepID=A0A6A6EY85_9PEZI|nr:hypothetical protein CERZMDRAFT_91974 [Cercospora zeae-maydis SCOH1-5]